MPAPPRRAVALHVLALLVVIVFATTFFVVYEHASWLASLNFVLMLITLVGSNYVPSTVLGVIVAGVLAFVSIGIIVSFISQVVVPWSGDLWRQARVQARKRERHIIVVGSADTAWEILERAPERTILVTPDKGPHDEALRRGFAAILGDPSRREVLEEAGIASAVALVAVSHDDALNAFACLSAKRIRPTLHVAARISREENREKLAQVGADDIVCPPTLAAERILSDLGRWDGPAGPASR
ncbi:MAG: potassium channel family protein [Thermoplasmatota archaeon]